MLHIVTSKSSAARALVVCVTIAGAGVTAGSRSLAQPFGSADVHGVVAGSYFVPASGSTPSSSVPSHYQHATVCADANGNGACDPGEPSASTDDDGAFFLPDPGAGGIVAEISTAATNSGHAVGQRVAFRAPAAQAVEGSMVVSPLSTEVARLMEADVIDYATARQKLATRLGVPADQVISDPNAIADAGIRTALVTESVILTNRFALAAKMADRHDTSTVTEAQHAAMNLERIPRYDHIFIIVLENKATSSIKNSPFAPKINAYLAGGNQFTSYFATGNPSEPNRVALASGDDFGIVDDSAWNCVPAGDVVDLPDDPLPAGLGPCTNVTNHNIKNKPNLLTAMSASRDDLEGL